MQIKRITPEQSKELLDSNPHFQFEIVEATLD